MEMNTTSPGQFDLCVEQLEQRIATVQAALYHLRTISEFSAGAAPSDGHFDVELTLSVNTTRAALMRLQILLAEKSGALQQYELALSAP